MGQKYRCGDTFLMFFLVSGHPINSHRTSWFVFPETTRSVNFMILCLDSPFGFAPGTFLTVGLATGRLEIHLPDSLSSKKVLQPGAQVQQDLDGGSQTVGHIREESSKDLA